MPGLVENAIKYGILTATSPIWWPIAKALWAELQASLWREGGLIGRPPTAQEIPILQERYKEFLSPLVNESLAEFKAREVREEETRVEDERIGRKGRRKKAAAAAASSKAASKSRGASVSRKGGQQASSAWRAPSSPARRPLAAQPKPQTKRGPSGSFHKRRGS